MVEQIDWAQIRTDLEALEVTLAATPPNSPVRAGDLLEVVRDLITWVIHETEETKVV